jgi:hypothetical protein
MLNPRTFLDQSAMMGGRRERKKPQNDTLSARDLSRGVGSPGLLPFPFLALGGLGFGFGLCLASSLRPPALLGPASVSLAVCRSISLTLPWSLERCKRFSARLPLRRGVDGRVTRAKCGACLVFSRIFSTDYPDHGPRGTIVIAVVAAVPIVVVVGRIPLLRWGGHRAPQPLRIRSPEVRYRWIINA